MERSRGRFIEELIERYGSSSVRISEYSSDADELKRLIEIKSKADSEGIISLSVDERHILMSALRREDTDPEKVMKLFEKMTNEQLGSLESDLDEENERTRLDALDLV